MKKVCIKMLFVVVLTTFLQLSVRADDDEPCDPETDPTCSNPGGDPDEIPLDPGSWVLVAAGVGYGVKKWKDSKMSQEKQINKTADYIYENKTDVPF